MDKLEQEATVGTVEAEKVGPVEVEVPQVMTIGTTERFLSGKEVARFIGVPAKTVVVWARYGKIPSYRVGKFVRFRLSEVNAWLQAGKK